MCIRDRLNNIKLPEGFRIAVFAEGVKNARSMCLTPGGTLFVGTREAGNVYACLLYTSDAADERSSVDLGGRRIIKKKKKQEKKSIKNE